MAAGAGKAVYFAIGGNSVVMVAKFGAFLATGSAAMLSEAIHSFADVGNQCLLALGLHRAKRVADAQHPYGYDREQFIWALISGVGIFFIGCGVTLYHGVTSLLHPHEVESLGVALGVLVFAFVVEGITLLVAVRTAQGMAKEAGLGFVEFLREGTEPAVVAVVLEDGAAVLGVVVAAIALTVTWATGSSLADSLATLFVGLLLGAIAIFLIVSNKQVLVGQAIAPKLRGEILERLNAEAAVEKVVDVKTTVLGSGALRFKAEVEFHGEEVARTVLGSIDLEALRRRVGSDEELRAFLADYGGKVIDALGDEVDRIEERLREAAPELRHIDLEVD